MITITVVYYTRTLSRLTMLYVINKLKIRVIAKIYLFRTGVPLRRILNIPEKKIKPLSRETKGKIRLD